VSVSLSTLRGRARTRADMVNSTFVSDAEMNEFINSAYSELWDLLVTTFEDFFKTSTDITLVAGTDTYSLSAITPAVYKLRGVDLILSSSPGNRISLARFEWNERDRYSFARAGGWTANGVRLRYCFQGNSIVFAPVPDGGNTVRVHYAPAMTALVADGDTVDGAVQDGWTEYIVLDAAIQALLKEESDVSVLLARKEALRQRIVGSASNRDAAEPIRMTRTRRRHYDDEDGWDGGGF